MKDIQTNKQNLPAVRANKPALPVEADAIDTEIDAPRRAGMIIVLLVFGVFGVWAAFAPLNGASHAAGTVTVGSYKKVVQHFEGGIVSEILVRNGDVVAAGDPLLVLDSTQSLAQLEIVNSQFVALSALEARLTAERDNLDEVKYPASLFETNANASAEIEVQNQIFTARKNALQGGTAVLEQRIEQLKSRLDGMAAMKSSKDELASSYGDELEDVRTLLKEGFADKIRLRELERAYATMRGEAAEMTADISSTQMQIGETRLQILQQTNEFQAEVANHLGETQSKLKDVSERVIALNDIVERTIIRAPVDGIINGMRVHTVGAVIGQGVALLDVVPQSEELVVEAKVSVIDIDRVHEGQDATIRFSSFGNRTPTIYGTVQSVSADALIDEATRAPYYLARVTVQPESLESLGNLALIPGMPAEVFITSGSRTFLQYVMKPFSNALARSLIED